MIETSEFWKKHNYELVLTSDQSPTLRWLGSQTQETMHHRGGAYSETQQIYGEPLRASLRAGERSALSVGLGLGYNEIMVALEACRARLQPEDFRLLSYESDSFLRDHFLDWVHGGSPSDLVYDEIFQFFAKDFKAGIDASAGVGADANTSVSAGDEARVDAGVEVKDWLSRAFQKGYWKLEGALLPEFDLNESYACVFYDAFSSKTSPHLWQEEFLVRFFEKACASQSWVTTYACTGALKRALKKNGFEVVIREGFQSKRNSTLGVRSLF